MRKVRAVLGLVLSLCMVITLANVTEESHAVSTEYGNYQPSLSQYQKWYPDDPSGDGFNGVRMVRVLDDGEVKIPPNVEVIQEPESADDSRPFINRITEPYKTTGDDKIVFNIAMKAGMGNFDESAFLYDGDLPKNIDNIRIYSADMQEIVAEYDESNGDMTYEGKSMNLDGRTTSFSIGVNTSALSNGEYVLYISKDLRGNRAAKTIKHDVEFIFTVSDVLPLDQMISKARTLFQSAQPGLEPGQYPQESYDAFQAAISHAEAVAADTSASQEESDAASDRLRDAFNAFKKARIVTINIDEISGIDSQIAVGDSGRATASLNITGGDDQQPKLVWTSDSECLEISSTNGKWYAKHEGSTNVTVSLKDYPELTKTIAVNVRADSNYDLDVCKADASESLESLVGKTDIQSIRISTVANGRLTEDDLEFIRSDLTGLKELNIKNATLSSDEGARRLPAGALRDCSSLETVVLPDNLTDIGEGAFSGCRSLANIEIPALVREIGKDAFAECQSMDETLSIYSALPPESQQETDIFGPAVKNLKVPYGCAADYKSERGWADYEYEEMAEETLTVNFTRTGALDIDSREAAEEQGLDMAKVSKVIFKSKDGVFLDKTFDQAFVRNHFQAALILDFRDTAFKDDNIKARTFADRLNVKEIRLPENITELGKQTFQGCTNMRKITVPESVVASVGPMIGEGKPGIGDNAFGGCPRLTVLVMNPVEYPGYDGTLPSTIEQIYVPAMAVDNYKEADGLSSSQKALIRPQLSLTFSQEEIPVELMTAKDLSQELTVDTILESNPEIKWYITPDSEEGIISLDEATGKTTANTRMGSVKVRAVANEGTMNETTASCTVNVVKPLPVTVTQTGGTYNTGTISWTEMTAAEGYQIQRKKSTSKSYVERKAVTGETLEFTDTGLTTGTRYQYRVRGYRTIDGVRVYSDYSNILTVKPVPNQVKGVKVKNIKTKSAKLTWYSAKGAKKYQVYRAKSEGGKFYRMTTTSKRSYTNKKLSKNKTYYYKVRAVGSNSSYGSYSDVVTVKIKK